MKPYIYLIFDKIKNKPYYVGKHNGNNKNYITGSKILRRYITIFGIDNYLIRFDKQILEYCSLDVLNKLDKRIDDIVHLFQVGQVTPETAKKVRNKVPLLAKKRIN